MQFSTAQTQLKSTERVLRRRPVTREHPCVAVESRAEAGAALRQRRVDDLDMTQQALADLADVGLSSVKRLESGKRLERKVERKISRALGWTEGSVKLVFAGQNPTPLTSEAAAERPWGEDFVTEVRAMTHEEMARRAAWVAHVTGSTDKGDELMDAMLRIRRDAGQAAAGS